MLDKQRLNKQITETQQILTCLLDGGSWKNHPAVRMWKGYEAALCLYGQLCQGAFVAVGGTCSHKSWLKIQEVMAERGLGNIPAFPQWIGREDIHSSHRARLLHKGNLDTARKRAKLIVDKVDDFVKEFFDSSRKLYLRDLTVEQVTDLHTFFDNQGVERFDNWYTQFGWSEQPGDDYVWPVELMG